MSGWNEARTYTYRLLDPRPAARQAELEFLASTPCLGVEVTVPELAAACQLGNIDPQHSGGDASTAAVEAAIDWPLPPDGATLVTVRPDADAYGAMAVLDIRAGHLPDPPGDPSPLEQWAALAEEVGCPRTDGHKQGRWCPATHRVAMIGEADRSAGTWAPGDDLEHVTQLQALTAACLATRDPAAGMLLARRWISLGAALPELDEWADRVREERRARAAVAAEVAAEVATAAGGRIAVVESASRFAVQAAYHRADVVVAVNPQFRRPGAGPDEQPHRKVTVCQRAPGHVDLPAVFAELSTWEPGWGGSPVIGGSPQGVHCEIATADVVAVVVRHLQEVTA